MEAKKILIIDEDVENAIATKILLSREEYKFILAYDREAGIEKARLERPDLILLNSDVTGIDGLSLSNKLKEDAVTKFIPIIAFVDLIDTLSGSAATLNTEAYLLKPFNARELVTEIERLLKRTVEQLSANPLTKLPGNISVEKNVSERILKKERFAACYLDLDNFKPYNDFYGFNKGDEVIKLLAQIIIDSIERKGTETDFIGHIGGDDFIVIATLEKVDDICNYVAQTFDAEIRKYYTKEDVDRGYITTKDRHYQMHDFPIMTVSISVATNEKRDIEHYGKIVDILVEMKKYVKAREDKTVSAFMKDRRKSDF